MKLGFSKNSIIIFIAMSMIFSSLVQPVKVFSEDLEGVIPEYGVSIFSRENEYYNHIKKYENQPLPDEEIQIDLSDFVLQDAKADFVNEFNEKSKVLMLYEGQGFVEIPINAETEGLYNIGFEYIVLESSKNDPEFKIEINGELQFANAEKLSITRVWRDSEVIREDSRGNQIRPNQEQIQKWQSYEIRDSYGIYNDPYLFYIKQGENTIRIYLSRSDIAISGMKVFNSKPLIKYDEYKSMHEDSATGNIDLLYQAEKTFEKSSQVLYPIYDRSSAKSKPNSPSKILLNTIGSNNWKNSGQWISWEIDVPEDGLYKISFRARQDIVRGMNSTRKFTIDGVVPFEEAGYIEFPYNVGWYEFTLKSNAGEFEIFLEEGKRILALEAVPGRVGDTLRRVEDIVFRLGAIYRSIIVVTGVNPDPNRDYFLDQNIPGLLDELSLLAIDMRKEADVISQITNNSGSMGSQLTEIARQLEDYVERPYTIQLRLSRMQSNISSLGTWIRVLSEQPLEIDYFQILSPEKLPEKANANIIESALFHLKSFYYSFIVDYDSVGDAYGTADAVDVWVPIGISGAIGVGSGREQINLIKRLIDEQFTEEFNINVNLKLVDSTNTIIQATFAGKGPDVALGISKTVPVDWAMRTALLDLSEFDGFEEVQKQFQPSVFIPYRYEGGVYALPETHSYLMFFYRKDIFESLGLVPPDTWDDFFKMIPRLQKSNLEIAMPSEYIFSGITGVADQIFQSLIFQQGKTYYTEDLRKTNFDDPVVLEAFRTWTSFYSQHGFPLSYDFFNRFRSGEMPCGFADYTMYNLFVVAAPEIRNLWEMVPIPGTVQDDGSINRLTGSNSMGCVIFSKTDKPDESYELIKWWVSSSTQISYAQNLEALLGTGARYPVANKDAFEEMPWTASEALNLKTQWEQTSDVPVIPGTYYVSRSLANAFRKVVYNWHNERETLFDYSKRMDEEILRKRTEFGLEG